MSDHEEDFDALIDDCAQDLTNKLDAPKVDVTTSEKANEKSAEAGFGVEDPEFKELLGDVLKDDEQAKEAMKGIAQMMQMMG